MGNRNGERNRESMYEKDRDRDRERERERVVSGKKTNSLRIRGEM